MKQTENIMGTKKILPLLVSMSIPPMVSMMIQALYNIVDSMYVARVSEDALTAVSLAYPLQNLILAVSVGFGIGLNACVARALGAKNEKETESTATHGIVLTGVHSVLFILIGLLLVKPFIGMFTDNAQIYKMSCEYAGIVLCFSFGSMYHLFAEKIFQSVGNMVLPMLFQAMGAVLNIILDPIMIFGLFGFPRMEVAGAALATITGQVVAVSMSFYFNATRNKEINISLKGFRPHAKTIAIIYEVGIPSIIMQAIGSVMTFGMNKILLMFSSTAAAVFGVYFKLQSFIFMPVFGLNNGMIPIIAYNYGARNKKRITQAAKLSVLIAVTIMIIGLIIFQTCSGFLLKNLFDASENMLSIGVPALRIISLSFLFAGYCIIVGSVFQALGNGVYSLIVSVARQLVVILPVAYLFARFFGLSMVWWSIPIAEIVSVILSTLLLRRIYRLKVKPLED